MGLIDRWNRFALRKIHINDRIEISAGRLVFGTIMCLLCYFTDFDLYWVWFLFGVKIHKKNNHEDDNDRD